MIADDVPFSDKMRGDVVQYRHHPDSSLSLLEDAIGNADARSKRKSPHTHFCATRSHSGGSASLDSQPTDRIIRFLLPIEPTYPDHTSVDCQVRAINDRLGFWPRVGWCGGEAAFRRPADLVPNAVTIDILVFVVARETHVGLKYQSAPVWGNAAQNIDTGSKNYQRVSVRRVVHSGVKLIDGTYIYDRPILCPCSLAKAKKGNPEETEEEPATCPLRLGARNNEALFAENLFLIDKPPLGL